MTRATAANATGMPSNRRAFLGNSIALASLLSSVATMPAIAADHPDAEILALGREWEASARREADAMQAMVDALARYEAPPWPEATFVRPNELFRHDIIQADEGDDLQPTGRYRYVRGRGHEFFRERSAHLTSMQKRSYFDDRELARANEIVAAFDAWEAEDERRFVESGTRATDEAHDREFVANRALVWRIVRTPARTLDGIFLKARAILWTQFDTVAEFERDWQNDLHPEPCESEQPRGLLLDILHLSGTTHAVPSLVRA